MPSSPQWRDPSVRARRRAASLPMRSCVRRCKRPLSAQRPSVASSPAPADSEVVSQRVGWCADRQKIFEEDFLPGHRNRVFFNVYCTGMVFDFVPRLAKFR